MKTKTAPPLVPRGKTLYVTAKPAGLYPKLAPQSNERPETFLEGFARGFRPFKRIILIEIVIFLIAIVSNQLFRDKYHYNSAKKTIGG